VKKGLDRRTKTRSILGIKKKVGRNASFFKVEEE
jgi:hypothetical protein